MLKLDGLRAHILDRVNLEISAGECVSLTGPSGSGKTILLRAIADLDPNSGEVSLNGRDRDAMPAPDWRRLVAYIPAETGWWRDTVGDHFPTAGRDDDGPAKLIAALGLPKDALGWTVARLSTGERQRLGLARALCNDPEVLLLDEPTSGLDREATKRVETLLRERLQRGGAILLVTHNRAQAKRLAKRHFTISDGRLATLNGNH